jgi:hypothetical protein
MAITIDGSGTITGASTLATTVASPTLTTPNINSAQFATVTGTAPIYPCRAWVNFNGTGTIAIRASGNVSSITDNAVGDYTVNFTTALADANYGYAVSGREDEGGTLTWAAVPQPARVAQTTTAFRIITKTSAGTAFDFNSVSLSVFR